MRAWNESRISARPPGPPLPELPGPPPPMLRDSVPGPGVPDDDSMFHRESGVYSMVVTTGNGKKGSTATSQPPRASQRPHVTDTCHGQPSRPQPHVRHTYRTRLLVGHPQRAADSTREAPRPRKLTVVVGRAARSPPPARRHTLAPEVVGGGGSHPRGDGGGGESSARKLTSVEQRTAISFSYLETFIHKRKVHFLPISGARVRIHRACVMHAYKHQYPREKKNPATWEKNTFRKIDPSVRKRAKHRG